MHSRGASNVAVFAVQPTLIDYLPIGTTLVAALFVSVLVRRYRAKGQGMHLLWWAIGVTTYGIGTGLESVITLTGNSILLNKSWYVMGALLGAYPLAQGTVYLLLQRRTATLLTRITLPFVLAVVVLVAVSPVNLDKLEPYHPSGSVLGWTWLRWLTPLINGYAALFLVGGALLSSWRFARKRATLHRAVGNALIAVGALLPGIGGIAAKTGTVELLYVTELVGLLFIWMGYAACVWSPKTGQLPSSNS